MDIEPFDEDVSNLYDKSLDEKIKYSKQIIERSLDKDPVVLWSGGKDSTAVLRLTLDLEPSVDVVYENTGGEFQETLEYIDEMSDEWDMENLKIIENDLSPWDEIQSSPENINNCTYRLKMRPYVDYLKNKGFESQILGDRADENARRKEKIESGGLIQEDSLLSSIDSEVQEVANLYPIAHWSERDVLDFSDKRGYEQNPLQETLGYTVCRFCPFHDFSKLKEEHSDVYEDLLDKTGSSDQEELKSKLKERFAPDYEGEEV